MVCKRYSTSADRPNPSMSLNWIWGCVMDLVISFTFRAFSYYKTNWNLVYTMCTWINYYLFFCLFRLWQIQVFHLDFKDRFLLSPIIKQLSYYDGTCVQTHKTYYFINKCSNIAYIKVLLMCSFLHGPLIKHFFPLSFSFCWSRGGWGFFCVGVLEGGIRRFCFAVLLCATSKYVFLHISLTMPAQNTASLQYADWRIFFSTFIAILDWVLCLDFLLRLQFQF